MREKHGEFMRIYWESGQPSVYVRGHVTSAEFDAVLSTQGISRARYGEAKHAFARYAMTGLVSGGEFDAEVRDYDTPGRGRFKVTRADETFHANFTLRDTER